MKNKYPYLITLVLCFSLAMLLSCSQEDAAGEPVEPATEQISLSFSLSGKTTRATETGDDNLNENRVETLDVFIYEANKDACVHYERITPAQNITGTYTSTLQKTQTFFTLDASYIAYAVANSTATIPTDGMNLSALKQIAQAGLEPDKIQDAFLMDGFSTATVLNDGVLTNKIIPVSLGRAAAKIRAGITFTNGFSLSGTVTKKLVHYTDESKTLADGNDITPTVQDMTAFTNMNSGAGSSDKIVVYSYANDWNTELHKETYLVVNIPMKDAQGTEYPENYYKVPVNYLLPENADEDNPAAQEAIYKLERNYLYDITIVVNKTGSVTPLTPVTLNTNYTIQEWTTKEIIVAVEALNFLYVENTTINMPNTSTATTTFQSSTPVVIENIRVNDVAIGNGTNGVQITATPDSKSGTIVINSSRPNNFVDKTITFTVRNQNNLTEDVTVTQYPALYIGYDISADEPGGSEGQDNNKMFIVNSLVADFSTLPNPDEFDENFGTGYWHYAADPELGASYASYIRNSGVLGYPRVDAQGATIDTEENNRMISPRFMIASQHGTTTTDSYLSSRQKCIVYQENDETTGELYTDWRMPTLAEVYMIDILQNIRLSEVKKILEGSWYWSARQSSSVKFIDPRVGNTPSYNALSSAVRCVRDVK